MAGRFFGFPSLMFLGFLAAWLVVVLVPASLICRRVGYPPWLGALAVLPLANVVLLWFVAFGKWPLEAEVERLRAGAASARG